MNDDKLPDTEARFAVERRKLHSDLINDGTLSVKDKIPSNSDKDSPLSVSLAQQLLLALNEDQYPESRKRMAAQTLGKRFEEHVERFILHTFVATLAHLRPGTWSVTRTAKIADYQQYAHLKQLADAAADSPALAAILGTDYTVKPDVVILRQPESDEHINSNNRLVDGTVSLASSLRKRVNPDPLMHASVSCKWTMRSDRAQNARTEALNLIRNRKGHLPHVVVITAEPLPNRLASIALGTGDIDCTYHVALNELQDAVKAGNHQDAKEMLNTMTTGKRLKDIADLPLDLAI